MKVSERCCSSGGSGEAGDTRLLRWGDPSGNSAIIRAAVWLQCNHEMTGCFNLP